MSNPTLDDLGAELPESFPVTVIMRARAGTTRWASEQWDALGVVVGERGGGGRDERRDGVRLVYHDGLRVRLYVDEAEGYYHNLMSPRPGCYVVAGIDERDGGPTPFLVTMSFDQANAYLEGGEEVFPVPIPPELYKWTEAFVLRHYAPRKKHKRKRDDWKDAPRPK